MESGKLRLSRDTTRDATRQEINALKQESEDLKHLVAELSLDLHRLKKTSIPSLCEGVANARASTRRLRSFRRLSHPRAPSARFYQSLESKNDCYRWRARARQGSLEDRRHPGPSWNRLSPHEESVVLDVALEQTDLSSRQLAAWITDNKGFSVSESTVYRLLMCQGLVKSPEMKMAAGKEFHAKTTHPHQMWATDASYFRRCGWGFYYLVTVMDDFSRFIIAWKL